MSFFDDTPEVPEYQPPEPRRRRWRGDSNDTLGVPVPYGHLLVRNDDVALLITNLVVFPAGFNVNVIALSRLERLNGLVGLHQQLGMDGTQTRNEGFRFGIEFSDGSKVTNNRHRGYSVREPGQPLLVPRGGGGGGRRYNHGFWCTSLPAPGRCASSVGGWLRV
jgi:hypothetical protein